MSGCNVPPFIRAAGNGNIPKMEAAMSVNQRNSTSKTALHWAAAYGRLAVVKRLVESGANVNAKDSTGVTPLTWAVWNGHYDIANYLEAMGATVSQYNRNVYASRIPPRQNDRSSAIGALTKTAVKNKLENISINNLKKPNITFRINNMNVKQSEIEEYGRPEVKMLFNANSIKLLINAKSYGSLPIKENLNQIKKVYRKLSIKNHPNKPGGSEERFKMLGRAYDGVRKWKNL